MEGKGQETSETGDRNLVETVVSILADPTSDSRNLLAGLGLLAVLSIMSLLHEGEAQAAASPTPRTMDTALSALSKLLGSKGKPALDPATMASMLPMLNQLLSQRTVTQEMKKDQPQMQSTESK